MTISSSRFSSSGRKCLLTSCMTRSRAIFMEFWPTMPARRCSAPRLDVMMITVFLKSTVLPCPSVSLPSSRTWSRVLNTATCAFSTSSKRITLYGLLLTCSVSCPPSSWPT
uniref:Hsp101 n=1 Tax=Arundo donax TaxID=35708 RepID=A0A0A9E2K9_ARUDO